MGKLLCLISNKTPPNWNMYSNGCVCMYIFFSIARILLLFAQCSRFFCHVLQSSSLFFQRGKKNLYINRKTAWSRTEFLCYEILFPPNIVFREKIASRFFLSQLWICIPLWFHMNCFANLNFLNRSTFFFTRHNLVL